MNCKPGDMAIVVRSHSGNEGRVVEIVAYYGYAKFHDGSAFSNCWLVKGRLNGGICFTASLFGADRLFPDSYLRPLRPDGITDEEVRDLYQPEGITA